MASNISLKFSIYRSYHPRAWQVARFDVFEAIKAIGCIFITHHSNIHADPYAKGVGLLGVTSNPFEINDIHNIRINDLVVWH